MTDAIAVLIADHETVQGLFDEFKKAKEADDRETMQATQARIFDELDTHTRIEEDIFYPAVRDLGVEDLTELIDEGVQEHHVVKVLMREIADLSDEDVYDAKMTVLIENVEHHVEEEESDMFPDVRDHMDSETLDELGARLEAAK